MDKHILRALRDRTSLIADRWEKLLRLEPVNTPLANPDALVYLIPSTVESVLKSLEKISLPTLTVAAARAALPGCECGHNPYLAYFIAGEQAMVEAVVLIQAEMPAGSARESDIAELYLVLRRLAQSEIDALCGVCSHREKAPACRFPERKSVKRNAAEAVSA